VNNETIEKPTDLLRELEYQITECEKTVLTEDNPLFDSRSKIIQAVLLEAYNMNLLIKHYPQLYPYRQCSIFSAIFEKYRKKSVSSATLDTIRYAFRDPEYDIYKILVYQTKKRKLATDQEVQEEGMGEKYATDLRVSEIIHFMDENADHPKLKAYMEQKSKEHVKSETRERKEREDEDKITIPRPDWLPPGVEGQTSLTSEAAHKMSEAWHDIAVRIFQFPPKQEEDDRFYSEGIETMHALLVPGTDLKYVRDTLSYLDITYEKETQSIHSAMSKSKILTPSGKFRKVTREQIADITPQMLLLSIHIIEKFPGFIKFCLYLIREQKPFSGEFHLNRHSKLSESAFGKSSLM
jgi:hypothetical protein